MWCKSALLWERAGPGIGEALFAALTKRILVCELDVDAIPPLLRAVAHIGRRLETRHWSFLSKPCSRKNQETRCKHIALLSLVAT